MNSPLGNWPPQDWQVDFAAASSLAIELAFDAPQPRHFAAPPATSRPYVVGGFNGEVARGASCNCRQLTLVPHCNGTHTESVGHLAAQPTTPLHRLLPAGPLPALLLSVTPETVPAGAACTASGEDSDPTPQAGDRLVTRAALQQAAAAAAPRGLPEAGAPLALVIRTLPRDAARALADYSDANPPYLSRQAVAWLVEQDIWHLLLDLPSLDRSHDEGRLSGHRLFFGLPPGSTDATQATRPLATVTEFACVPDTLHDGAYALLLQVPAFTGDAVPSRPLLCPLRKVDP